MILSAFWHFIDTKGTDPFADLGDHRHFSKGLSFLDFGDGARVGIFEDLNFDRQFSHQENTFGEVLPTAQAYEFHLGSKTFPRSDADRGSG